MKRMYGVVVLVTLSSLQLAGMVPTSRAAREHAIKLLRAFYPKINIVTGQGNPIVESDVLDECVSGDKRAHAMFDWIIRKEESAAYSMVTKVESHKLTTAGIEENVSRFLPAAEHPCHNLTENTGDGGPSKGYWFAKSWIDSGNLRKAVAAKYTPLIEALNSLKQ